MAGRKKVGQLIGKEALTIARTITGSHAYIYRGQPVPKDVPEDEAQRLLDEGFLAEAPSVEAETTSTPAAPRRSRSGGSGSKKPAAAEDDGAAGDDSSDDSGDTGDSDESAGDTGTGDSGNE